MSSSTLDLGPEAGLRYATEHSRDRHLLGRIAVARGAADVAAIVGGSSDEPTGIADRAAYWSGFSHGVRRFLQEQPDTLADRAS